jgi:hypothetical protein
MFPNHKIINPNTPEHGNDCRKLLGNNPTPGKEITYFLKLSDTCDIGCFLQFYKDRWSAGSAAEANHMLNNGKQIFQINLEKQTLERINKPVSSFTFQETMNKLKENGKGYLCS